MGLFSGALVMADRVTLDYPTADQLLDDRTRDSRGMREPGRASVTVRGQLEPMGEGRRGFGLVGADLDTRQVLILDAEACRTAGYDPSTRTTTHRLRSIRWHGTGREVEYLVYLEEATLDAAGKLWRCALHDRHPARAHERELA